MSVEQAKAFIEKMKTDEAFREKIMAIETPEERLKAIGAAGFPCNGVEINEAAADVGESAGGWGLMGAGLRLGLYISYCR
ncbi:MAG: Nif11-like leader peptide family natural product precursor [Chlorobiaceae bacterium]|nr:Nif11-like leader peptide family natural product precursor [Chlorobiaceae bacterium]